LLTDVWGISIDFRLSGGQTNDCTQAIALLGISQAETVLADKDYDAEANVAHVQQMGAKAVIPPKPNRKVKRELYKQRRRIECCTTKSLTSADSLHGTKNQKPRSTP
jgi:transposase